MCLSPAVGFRLTAAIVVLQCVLVFVADFGLQWADCDIPRVPEFSFGMQEIRINAGFKVHFNIHLLLVLQRNLGVQRWTGALSPSFTGLVTATDTTLGMTMTGFCCGVLAAVAGFMGTMKEAPCKGLPKSKLFAVSAALLVADFIFMLIAVLLWTLYVMPALDDIGIADMAKALKPSTVTVTWTGGFTSGLVSTAFTCSRPRLCGGCWLTIVQCVLVALAGGIMAIGIKHPQDDGRRPMIRDGMQMQTMSSMAGRGGPGGMGQMGGYGAPPGGGGYGRPPAYGGPPAFPAYGGPQPGYGGPPGAMAPANRW